MPLNSPLAKDKVFTLTQNDTEGKKQFDFTSVKLLVSSCQVLAYRGVVFADRRAITFSALSSHERRPSGT